jgi:hypothetical protein
MRSGTLLGFLMEAGTEGLTTMELAEKVYGNSDYPARGKVTMLAQNLRRKGHTIIWVGVYRGKTKVGRYVLVGKSDQNRS